MQIVLKGILELLLVSAVTITLTRGSTVNDYEMEDEDFFYPGFQSPEVEEEFFEYIFRNHTVSSHPIGLQNNTVQIQTDLMQIVDIDEKQGLIVLRIFYYIKYTDDTMTWDPEEWGVGRVTVPKEKVWVPDIVHYDAAEVIYEEMSDIVMIYPGGLVVASIEVQYVSITCNFDVSDFPYDKQECTFRIGSWFSSKHFYKIAVPQDKQMSLEWYIENEQWELTRPVEAKRVITYSETARQINSFQTAQYTIRVQRRPMFYQNIIIFPTITLLYVTSMVFFLPVDSGEKVSLGITLLLAQSVNLIVLMDILPPSSNNFPILGAYVLLAVILTCSSVIMAILMASLHFKEEHVPKLLARIVRSRTFEILCCVKTRKHDDQAFTEPVSSSPQKERKDHNKNNMKRMSMTELGEYSKKVQHAIADLLEVEPMSYKDLVLVMDQLIFRLYLAINTAATAWLMITLRY